MLNKVAVIIPSLEPDEKLLSLLKELTVYGFEHIFVINDGSGRQYQSYFDAAQQQYHCRVIMHSVNLGKGRALKTAFNCILTEYPQIEAAVTVDSDGQHRLNDIVTVAQSALDNPDSLIMGCRDFFSKNRTIPARSRFGNVMTHYALKILCGIKLSDTQTGLRGLSRPLMKAFMTTKGERFEYEMNMILDAKEKGISIKEVPIETVYIEENQTSHFNPLKDSFRIYAVFSKFIAASVSSFLIDIVLFTLFNIILTHWLQPAMSIVISSYSARVLSALFNYIINKNKVFKNNTAGFGTLVKYAVLCVAQVTISAFATKWLFQLLHISATVIKIVVDILLFLVSFQIQRGWVFKKS